MCLQGAPINTTEGRAVMHVALRAPKDKVPFQLRLQKRKTEVLEIFGLIIKSPLHSFKDDAFSSILPFSLRLF